MQIIAVNVGLPGEDRWRGEPVPTGIFKDAAENLIASHIPAPTPERVRQALDVGLRYAAEHGVTSVQEMANDARQTLADRLRVYQDALREGKLTVRISQFPGLYTWHNQASLGIQAGYGSPMLRLGGLKAFADGSLGSTTAWFLLPMWILRIPAASQATP